MGKTTVWQDTEDKSCFMDLRQDLTVDVAIIGGGITGITTGYLLASAGVSVAVLEAWRVGGGTTGHSTGNLYATVDEQLNKLRSKYDLPTIEKVASSRAAAVNFIENMVRKYNMDCHFRRVPWYLISESEEDNHTVEIEYEACRDAGLLSSLENVSPLPFKIHRAAKVMDQAQYNPRLYLKEFAQHAEKAGCRIYEHTKVFNIEEGDPHILHTAAGKVTAKYIVHATHSPKGVMFVQTLLGPYREYALAVKLNNDVYPEGIFWTFNKPHHHSIRTYTDAKGEKYLLILGEPHKVGQKEHNEECFTKLESYIRERFDVSEIKYRWAAQHYKAADGLAYIGRREKDSTVFIATGFSTDGLTYGTLAAQMIADEITGKENPYKELYAPYRHNPMKSAGDFIKENVNVLGQYLKDIPYKAEIEKLSDVPSGEAKTIEVDGEKYGAYRDHSGKLHVVSIVCTHMKCILSWNHAERTWDCPCHGSRFNHDGLVIEGPAISDLPKMSDKNESK